MTSKSWSVVSMPAYKSRSREELHVLWASSLPSYRDAEPALWDSLVGFFEDAIVASCSRPGCLVLTPREILKQLKHDGMEPSSGMRVIEELFKRGDIVSADTLKPPTSVPAQSSYSLGALKSSIGSYFWGSKKLVVPSLDDPIVPLTALKSLVERVSSLSGPMASADIHTVKTFAAEITAGNTRDAEAVIAHIVAKGEASVLFTEPTKDVPEPILGVKIGKGSPTEADKGVLRTKAALEQMEKRSAHLSEEVEKEVAAATSAAKAGKRNEALARLRKKKALESKLSGTRAAATKLSEVLMAVDEAESNREAVSALETGMSSLRVATEDGITADRVDAVAQDFDEMLAEQQDVRSALAQLNEETDENDALLEQELNELLVDENSTKPSMKPQTTTEEEEELRKIMQSLDISLEDAAKMKDPVQVAQEKVSNKDQIDAPTASSQTGEAGQTGTETGNLSAPVS